MHTQASLAIPLSSLKKSKQKTKHNNNNNKKKKKKHKTWARMKIVAKVMEEMDFFYIDMLCSIIPIRKTASLLN